MLFVNDEKGKVKEFGGRINSEGHRINFRAIPVA